MPRGVWFCWRIAKAPGIKHGTFLRLLIRRQENSSLNSLLMSSERNRNTDCSPVRCSGWQDGSIPPSENCTRCSTSTKLSTSSIQRNSRKRSAFSRLFTPKASAEQLKPTDNRESCPDLKHLKTSQTRIGGFRNGDANRKIRVKLDVGIPPESRASM